MILTKRIRRQISIGVVFGLLMLGISSCYTSKNQILFQHLSDTTYNASMVQPRPIIQRGDQLSILVYGLDEKSTSYFNYPMGGTGSMTFSQGAQGNSMIGYVVNEEGTIEFPKLGTLHILGYTQEQLRDSLQRWLLPWVKDPVINVRLLNFRVTYITTDHAQTVVIPNNKTNIIQFLGMVGGISWSDRKTNIKIIRQVEEKRQVYVVDFTKKDVFTSPVYYMQPNDIVYVEPNRRKYIESNVQLITLITSLSSTVSIFVLFLNSLK